MIRKDVKLGFAIGGVLLAVLVVYVLVGTGGGEDKGKTAAPIVTEESSTAAHNSTTPGGSNGGVASAAGHDGGPAGAHDSLLTPPVPLFGSKEGASSTTGAAAQGPTTKPDDSAAVASSSQNDPNRDLWGNALNNGQLLFSQTPTPAGGISARHPGNAGANASGNDATSASDAATPSTQPLLMDETDNHAAAAAGTVARGATAVAAPAAGSSASPVGLVGATATTHVVQRGETLASISQTAYGSPNYYPHILRANPSLDPKKLKPGMTINLPAATDVKPQGPTAGVAGSAGSAGTPTTALDSKSEYRVESGDSLYKIAMKLYGKPEMTDKIYDLNKDAIGSDRAKLKLHMLLKLPEPPTQTAAR